MNFVAYETTTGRITRAGFAPDGHEAGQAMAHESILTGDGNDSDHYVSNGVIAAFTPAEIDAKKNLAQGWVWKMPERIAVDARILPEAKAIAWERIKLSRTAAEEKAFTFNAQLYDANIEKIGGAVQMALIAQVASAPFTIDWTLADNSVVTLNAQQMIGVGVALGRHIAAIYDTARALRETIDSATSKQNVDAISWPP